MPLSDWSKSEDLVEPASMEAIATAEAALGCRFPADYVGFLRLTDGYDGYVGEQERYLAA